MWLFILWIKALFGLMEEEGKKKKKGITFLYLVRKEYKKEEEWEGKRLLQNPLFFSLKVTLVPSKGLVYFCEMTFISHIFPFCFSSYPNTPKEILYFRFFLSLTFSFLFSSLPFPSTEPNNLRASSAAFLNFCTVWRMNSCIYLCRGWFFVCNHVSSARGVTC